MFFRNAVLFASLLTSTTAFAGSFQDEEEIALTMARSGYSDELKAAMHIDYAGTVVHTLHDRKGADIGYWVSVEVDGFENGAATKRHYRVESANEAGIITNVKLVKMEGPVGP